MKPMLLGGLTLLMALHHAASKDAPALTAQQALDRLLEGNKRYVAGQMTHPNQTPECRTRLTQGQHPIAVILSCSDSRVPPEIVFDQGLGDLFVIRVAGNVADDAALGSIEYAVEHLGVPLIVVLGHERCGAVTAAVEGGEAPGHIAALVRPIQLAVEQARLGGQARKQPGDLVDNAVRANVRMVVAQMKSSKPILAELVKSGKLTVVGARYDLETGKVEILP